jgi:hypothetical protein
LRAIRCEVTEIFHIVKTSVKKKLLFLFADFERGTTFQDWFSGK